MVANNMSMMRTIGRRHTVVGVFDSAEAAEWTIENLRDAGLSPDQVSVVARYMRDVRDIATHVDLGEDGDVANAGTGALILPGIGQVVAAGALATALAGAAAGGLRGALIDLGVPAVAAFSYEEGVRAGGLLVTVSADNAQQADEAHRIFNLYCGLDVRDFGASASLNS